MVKHSFPSVQQPWIPGRMEVNGRGDRRVVCVVAEDGGRYSLFDVDSWRGGDEGEEEDGGGGGGNGG